MSHKLINMN